MADPIVVFGGTGGLGRAVCERLERTGATVIGLGRSVDVRDRGRVRAFFAAEAPRPSAVVYLAGVFQGGRPFVDTPAEWFLELWQTHVEGAVHVFQEALPRLLARGEGSLLAVGALAAERHTPGLSAYNTAKAALHGLVLTLAEELKGERITVNLLLPTVIDTEANRAAMGSEEAARWVRPENVAELVAFLLSPAGKDVHGAAIAVRGRL